MIIFCIIFVISIICSIAIVRDLSYGQTIIKKIINYFCGIVMAIFITGLLTPMIWGLGGQLFMKDMPYTEKVVHELVSINDGNNTDGNFILGSGHIGEKQVYNYYRKDDSGGIVRRSISANLTTIYEVDSLDTPRLEVYIVKELNDSWWLPISGNAGYQKYHLYLPTGSIIKEIKLDNE